MSIKSFVEIHWTKKRRKIFQYSAKYSSSQLSLRGKFPPFLPWIQFSLLYTNFIHGNFYWNLDLFDFLFSSIEFFKFNRLFYQIINEIKLIYKYFLFFSENVHFFFFYSTRFYEHLCRKNSFMGNGGRNEKKNTTVNLRNTYVLWPRNRTITRFRIIFANCVLRLRSWFFLSCGVIEALSC